MLDNNCRYKTVKGYVESINTLFKLRGFAIPIDLSDKQNTCTRLIDEIEREETIAKQRSPLTKDMFVNMGRLAAISPKNSANSVLHDWFCLIRICGFRVAEYAQTTQTKIDVHQYSSGKEVIKAFLPGDWVFKNEKGRVIKINTLGEVTDTPKELKITFRIQKNWQNGQSITIMSDDDHPEICPVRAALRIFLRAKELGQTDSQPMAIFENQLGKAKYLTGNKIAELLQSLARSTHPDMTLDEISKFSSHSGRVWAVVLLDEAGKASDFIKSQLCWLGDSYRTYLRDTSVIQHQHIDALKTHSDEIMKLYGRNHSILPDTAPIDTQMGTYNDLDHLETGL